MRDNFVVSNDVFDLIGPQRNVWEMNLVGPQRNVWEMNLVGQKDLSFISIINKFDLIKSYDIYVKCFNISSTINE